MPESELSAGALAALREAFGEALSTAGAVLDAHGRDESGLEFARPGAVLFARGEADVVQLLALARGFAFPVVPFAAGSSLEGQLIPPPGAVSLDLSGLTGIVEVCPASFLAVVEPGVTYPQLNRALRPHGLFFPVDPGAEATLGGMASTNASGTAAVRYGTTRENVLALRVALADGRVLSLGSRARKSSAGYDLRHLFLGAEGTLGVITQLTVRLWPLPAHRAALRGAFPDLTAAADAAARVMGAALQPERLELMDAQGLRAVNRHLGRAFPEVPTLWAELTGPSGAALEEALSLCAELFRDAGARDVQVARGAAELEGLWEARHRAFYALKALYPGEVFLSTDLCVPLHELAGVIAFTHERLREAGLDASVLGHVGDGNFHVLFHAPAGDAATWERIGVTYDRMVAETLRVGGTCSGEHGVGLHKRRFLRAQHGEALDLMREVKALLDPLNILNPGKVLPDEH
ncbi:2-hydroxy-acid oxidase [Deinococcus indicus]|uniref:D-lactate dehydrogenase (cytochrome) n=1 Tax=Deinococcus indicus TaxID=223556 RepID=A0A246BNU7_9DEIO|nr:FAD-linked oxidase C-terminal domain-containing protein [Deinococcus indicus]OWL97314.1 2-hydroxy-acid oxidase [Deinococcus indicus]GHG32108.1 oxidoreductase [Deinococcus indicus]